MKKILTFLLVLLVSKFTMAQVPEIINYQGVARNAQGQAIANQPIKVRASLIDDYDGTSQTTFYTETRTLTTNQLGLFSFKIGDYTATTTTGSFDKGNWLEGQHAQYLKIEIDVNNSGSWTDMGTQRIVSVPFAMYAKNAITAQEMSIAPNHFNVKSTAAQTIPANAAQKVSFEAKEFSHYIGFDIVTGEFAVPDLGMYHFDLSAYISYGDAIASGTVYARIHVNGVTRLENAVYCNGKSAMVSFGGNLFINKGDKVTVSFFNQTNTSGSLGANYTFFSGHRLY